jgi:hypothetical protein
VHQEVFDGGEPAGRELPGASRTDAAQVPQLEVESAATVLGKRRRSPEARYA